ncbi:hypothetical protein [Peptoniphilus sp.]|jgi:hypothetical protein|uniref:hypothetical protein n=1 Tax=Peptoniphilus sp. TaxID=1971214 RepID=UPI003D8C0789
MKKLSRFENRLEDILQQFVKRHFFIGFLVVFVGFPLLATAILMAATSVISFIIALLFGWN